MILHDPHKRISRPALLRRGQVISDDLTAYAAAARARLALLDDADHQTETGKDRE